MKNNFAFISYHFFPILTPFSCTDSEEMQEFRRELASASPLQWYFLVNYFIVPFGERIDEMPNFQETALNVFEAEQKGPLSMLARVLKTDDEGHLSKGNEGKLSKITENTVLC